MVSIWFPFKLLNQPHLKQSTEKASQLVEMKPVFITILQTGLEVNFGGLLCIICLQALLQDGCKEEFNQNCCIK